MQTVIQYLRATSHERLEQLLAYLRIPSISSDPGGFERMRHSAEFTAQLLARAGLREVRVRETGGQPLVTADWLGAPGAPTILIYGHHDVQPVDPLSLWRGNPFEPRLEGDRVVARGAADDKGQILMHIHAVGAWLKAVGRLPVNLKFLVEGEEEVGSPHLPAFLAAHPGEFDADFALVSDSNMWAEGVPAITIGLRGLVCFQVEMTGPDRDLHSGTFGGAVANPLEMLARLLASVKDDDGRILIPGFYDNVRELSPDERRAIRALPLDEAAWLAAIGLKEGRGEAGYGLLERTWTRPTFEINGLWGGFTGEGSKTVLPSKAHAKLSLRLTPDQDPEAMLALTTRFLTERAPAGTTLSVHRFPGGGKACAIDGNSPAVAALSRALREAFGRSPLLIREGGSIPIVAEFKERLGAETLLVGFALPDSRTHSPNENFHLPTFHQGTEALALALEYLGRELV